MWGKKRVELLREEIEAILSTFSSEPSFYSFIKESLTQAKYGLDSINAIEKPWPLLPLMVCESISGRYKHAIPVAAALHLIKASAEIFDDIEDQDFPGSLSSKYGPALAINAATTILTLAERTFTRLQMGKVADDTIIRVIETVNSYLISACAGQHLDLSTHDSMLISEDKYLHNLSLKSAFIVECACRIGALLATSNEQLTEVFAMFGNNLGMASQIANDILGIIQGNDIKNRKITLPVIYVLAKADNKTRDILDSAFYKPSNSQPGINRIKGLLFNTGAIHYATIRMETYKQKASAILSKAGKMKADTRQLKVFLE